MRLMTQGRSDDDIRADLAYANTAQGHEAHEAYRQLGFDVEPLLARAVAAEARVAQLREANEQLHMGWSGALRELAAARAKIAAVETVTTHFDVDTGTGPLAVTDQDVTRRIFAALAAASGQCPTCGAEVWEVDGPDVTAEGVPSQCANGHQFYAPHALAAASGVAPDKPAPTTGLDPFDAAMLTVDDVTIRLPAERGSGVAPTNRTETSDES